MLGLKLVVMQRMLIGVGVCEMFIINPKSIKNLSVYFASPKIADVLLYDYGIMPLCYMTDDVDGQLKAGFRITEELIDILKRISVGLGKE